MTGEDHNSDALIAALRSPALPSEQVGEATAVSAMIGAQTLVPAASQGPRSRRGIAIAAVTVASLGLGGLAAAGPGIFSPAADQPETTSPTPTTVSEALVAESSEQTEDDELAPDDPKVVRGVDRISEDPDVECTEGNHGKTVSSIAKNTAVERGDVSVAAQSDCGKPAPSGDEADGAEVDGDIECAEGNHGKTVSSIAQSSVPEADKGDVVSNAARSECGKPGDGEAPGQSGEAPGQSGEAPGQSGEAPGQSGEAPGQSDDNPANPVAPPTHPETPAGPPNTLPGPPDNPRP